MFAILSRGSLPSSAAPLLRHLHSLSVKESINYQYRAAADDRLEYNYKVHKSRAAAGEGLELLEYPGFEHYALALLQQAAAAHVAKLIIIVILYTLCL